VEYKNTCSASRLPRLGLGLLQPPLRLEAALDLCGRNARRLGLVVRLLHRRLVLCLQPLLYASRLNASCQPLLLNPRHQLSLSADAQDFTWLQSSR